MVKSNHKRVIKNILSDIRVELKDEFDKNFAREGFFSETWERRRSPIRPGRAVLTDTGDLRKSIGSEITENSIVFFSNLPYAGIHNEGGEIVVTHKMKMFFRYKFYQSAGGFGRKGKKSNTPFKRISDGAFYNWTANKSYSEEAEFWRFLSLKKEGSTIKIPRRRFLDFSPEVEKIVTDTIENCLEEYFKNEEK